MPRLGVVSRKADLLFALSSLIKYVMSDFRKARSLALPSWIREQKFADNTTLFKFAAMFLMSSGRVKVLDYNRYYLSVLHYDSSKKDYLAFPSNGNYFQYLT